QSSTTNGFTPLPNNLDWQHASGAHRVFVNCNHRPADDCRVVHGTGARILLIGDSHAQMFVPTFETIARREHLTLSVSVSGLCPWQRDLYAGTPPNARKSSRLSPRACKALKDDLYTRVIPALRP